MAQLPSPSRVTTKHPTWDPDGRRLLWGGRVLKVYHHSAAEQQLILAAFEEQGWPNRIDDPLSPKFLLDSVERLHNTIRSLNDRLEGIRFHCDGSGTGIRWELLPRTKK